MLAMAVVVALGGVSVPASAAPPLANCPLFPATNVWNKRVDSLPVAANSNALINAIGRSHPLHPDFGSPRAYGIPYVVVGKQAKRVKVKFTDYGDEADHVLRSVENTTTE